jgi:hypothetical protein
MALNYKTTRIPNTQKFKKDSLHEQILKSLELPTFTIDEYA